MRTSKLAWSLSALFAVSTAAQAVLIDDFDDPALPGTQEAIDSTGPLADGGSPIPVASEYLSGNIVGGSRDLIADKLNDEFGNTSLIVADGQLRFSNDTGVVGFGIVKWDGVNAGDPTDVQYALDEDLTSQEGCEVFADGCDSLSLDIVSADLNFDFEIEVATDAGNSSTLLFTVDSAVTAPGTNLKIPFDEFLLADGATGSISGFSYLLSRTGAVDFTDVGLIAMGLNVVGAVGGTVDLDARFGSIGKTGVPEPTSLALLGLGIAGLGAASARGRRKDR